MERHILLFFMSGIHLDFSTKNLITSTYTEAQIIGELKEKENFQAECIQTNESAVKYINKKLKNANKKLEKIFLFTTNLTHGPLHYRDGQGKMIETTHIGLLKERLIEAIPSLKSSIEEVAYNEGEFGVKNFETIIEMSQRIKQYMLEELQAEDELVLHVDMTGGFRHATMLMLAVMQLLKYNGVKLGKIVYSNYVVDNRSGVIEEISDIHRIFGLVSGAEEFVRFGSVEEIEEYFENKKKSPELEKLLQVMKNLAETLELCKSNIVEKNLHDLKQAIDSFEEKIASTAEVKLEEVLFAQLLDTINKEYAAIIKDDVTKLDIIAWCVRKGFMQQAMTFYTEWIPQYIVEREIVYPANQVIIDACKERREDYEAWEKYFLTKYVQKSEGKSGTDSLLKNSNDEIKKIRNYFEWIKFDDKLNMEQLVLMLDNEKVATVIMDCLQFTNFRKKLKKGVLTLEAIKMEKPDLYKVVEALYATTQTGKGAYAGDLASYWLNKLEQEKIFNMLKTLKSEQLKNIFCIKTEPIKVKVKSNKLTAKEKAMKRTERIKEYLEQETFVSKYNKTLSLQIAQDYNEIKNLRNQINHADVEALLPATEVIKDKIKECIERLQNIEK